MDEKVLQIAIVGRPDIAMSVEAQRVTNAHIFDESIASRTKKLGGTDAAVIFSDNSVLGNLSFLYRQVRDIAERMPKAKIFIAVEGGSAQIKTLKELFPDPNIMIVDAADKNNLLNTVARQTRNKEMRPEGMVESFAQTKGLNGKKVADFIIKHQSNREVAVACFNNPEFKKMLYKDLGSLKKILTAAKTGPNANGPLRDAFNSTTIMEGLPLKDRKKMDDVVRKLNDALKKSTPNPPSPRMSRR